MTPSTWAGISCSIFIASSTTSGSPAAIRSSALRAIAMTVPANGACRRTSGTLRERYATTVRTAARISSGEALSPASADMCDQAMAPPGATTSEPPSWAEFPTVRVCIRRVRAPARMPLVTLLGPNSSVMFAIFAPAAR